MRSILKSKRSAEMTIGTIIIIILAVLVLVFLVFGFSTGWNNLWENIKNFFGGGANVDTVVRNCQAACTTNQVFEYCRDRDVKFEDKTKQTLNCKKLEGGYGLEQCGAITVCPPTCKLKEGVKATCGEYKTQDECIKAPATQGCTRDPSVVDPEFKCKVDTSKSPAAVSAPTCSAAKTAEACSKLDQKFCGWLA
jgi:hypothetical protein